MKKLVSLIVRIVLGMAVAALAFTSLPNRAYAAEALPQVELNADNIGPRPIEELTSQVVTRDYALAWQTMSMALQNSRADLLDEYFTGWAKDNLSKLISNEDQTGVHIRYVDHGHKLEGLFYAPGGDAMQLRDTATLEIQTLDGDKVIHSDQVTLHYLVLMTPGADRWLVRDLQAVGEGNR